MPVTITTPPVLDVGQHAAVLALAEAVEATDGAPPLSDQGRIQLDSGQVRHVVATDGDTVVGYAQLAGAAAELLGRPDALDPLLDALQASAVPFELWAHGARSRLTPVLDARGYSADRVLWQLRWPVAPLAPTPLPESVTVRAFVPGQDEASWLAINAAAFAHHPEQGGWSRADLLAREAEPWFDPAGFLLAVDQADQADQLVGYHWTKKHSPSLGEVYVIGIAPAAQGRHLGQALLVAGLDYLRSTGCTEVLLYVDESNTTAVALYEKYGFTRYDRDAQYRYVPAE